MSADETEEQVPAPPVVPPAPTGEPEEHSRDNPITLAGLMISVLGLVLSIVVIGAFIGIAGFILSSVGLRRARERDLDGRKIAITGMVLGVLSVAMSVVGFFTIQAMVGSSDPVFVDGIATTSRNTEHPPQSDFDDIECGTSNTGRIAQATVQLTNRSTDRSVYQVRVEWNTDAGTTVHNVITTDYVEPGTTTEVEAIDLSGDGEPRTCQVTAIERSSIPFFR